jgi:polysaccharide export outer membrane protein
MDATGDPSRPENNSATTLPPQIVDRSGKISVPFAGDIQVEGLTLREIRHEIESKLAKRALEPQAIVSLPETGAGTVTVLGDAVTVSSAVKLRATGDRILEVIGRSGGIKVQEYETLVSLQRGNKRGTIYYPKLVRDPKENIYVQPGDIISVSRYQRKFEAFGALVSLVQTQGLTGQFTFESEHLSLGEALSKTGGLLDSRADALEVYLYRMETRETLRSIGVDLAPFRLSQQSIPTIYRVSLGDPSGFFLTHRFPMRDKDIIYVPNAKSVEVAKFFDNVRTITGGVSGITGDAYATTYPAHAVGH